MFSNRILVNGVLIPKLLNKSFASCSFTNLDFLIPQTGHFNCIINILFFNYSWVNIFSIFSALHAINLYLTFITSVSKTLNYFLLLCFCFKNLGLFDHQITQFDFSMSTLFLWPKIISKIFTPKTIRCSRSFSNFYRFYILLLFFSFFVFW